MHWTRKALQHGISAASQTSWWLYTGTRAVKHHPKYCSSMSQSPLKASPGCSFPCWAFHLCYSFLCLSSHLCLERQGHEDRGSQWLRCCHRHHRHLRRLAGACCLPSCCIHRGCQGLQGQSYFNLLLGLGYFRHQDEQCNPSSDNPLTQAGQLMMH